MIDFKSALLGPEAVVCQAVKVIDRGEGKIALVVDPDGRLLGTVTDGDIRRGLLRGEGMESPIARVMNRQPMTAPIGEKKDVLFQRMRTERVRQLPLLDSVGRVLGLETLTALLLDQRRNNWVVLMAGGEGRRLRPLTAETPKPMLPVGSKPLLETIMDRFVAAGFYRFYLSVNYKASIVEEHFGDGSSRGIEIRYLREQEALGTAGSLSLLPERPNAPFFVMNGDILTNLDFGHVLDFHHDHHRMATMCVREYDLQVPYGVVNIDGHRLVGILEKPTLRHFVNAGIYVLEPEALDYLTPKTEMSMPQLFETLMERDQCCSVCPVREYWVDIGHLADFERANSEFPAVFND